MLSDLLADKLNQFQFKFEEIKKYWMYVLPILIPAFIFYILEFLSLILVMSQMFAALVIGGMFLGFLSGMIMGIYSFAGVESIGDWMKLRIATMAPISWGYNLTVWLLSEPEPDEKKSEGKPPKKK